MLKNPPGSLLSEGDSSDESSCSSSDSDDDTPVHAMTMAPMQDVVCLAPSYSSPVKSISIGPAFISPSGGAEEIRKGSDLQCRPCVPVKGKAVPLFMSFKPHDVASAQDVKPDKKCTRLVSSPDGKAYKRGWANRSKSSVKVRCSAGKERYVDPRFVKKYCLGHGLNGEKCTGVLFQYTKCGLDRRFMRRSNGERYNGLQSDDLMYVVEHSAGCATGHDIMESFANQLAVSTDANAGLDSGTILTNQTVKMAEHDKMRKYSGLRASPYKATDDRKVRRLTSAKRRERF